MTKRFREDTGAIIDQQNGELIDTITKTKNLLNKQDKRITELEKENIDIKTLIKTMMENERTHIGYNTLKQLWEAIQ